MRSFLHSFRFRGKIATDPEASPMQQFKPLENTPPLNDNRWSDVVPPKSALVFAVVWGPDDEIVTFSEADLFDLGEGDLNVAPCYPASDARDDRSQMLTLGHSSVLLSAHPSTLAFFRDKHEHLFSQQTDRAVFGGARTSSTLGGLDVYLRGSMLGKTFPIYKRYSCLEDMDTEVHFETQDLFADVSPRGWHGQDDGMTSFNDEGYYEGVPTHNAIQGEVILSSAFSTTTTSTSNYISVDPNDAQSAFWSTLDAPTTPGFTNSHIENQRLMNKKLKKPHPARATDVLQRETYSHEAEFRPPRWGAHPCATKLARLVQALGPRKAGAGDESWVFLDISSWFKPIADNIRL